MEPTMLTRSDVSLLAVRLFALYLIAEGVSASPALHGILSDQGMSAAQRLTLSTAIVGMAVVGVAVLVFSPALARRLMPATGAQSDSPANLAQIQSTAIATFGLILIATTLPNLAGTAVLMIERPSDEGFMGSYGRAAMASEIAALVIGIVLCTGASFWTRLLAKFRDLGYENGDSEDS